MSVCGTWPTGWLTAGNTEITRLLNGNWRRLGIPKRANYYTTRESVKGWTPYAPKLRGLRLRLDTHQFSRISWQGLLGTGAVPSLLQAGPAQEHAFLFIPTARL
jgi:hypothetical protein